MEIFEHIKKHAGLFVIPFTFIAFITDFGVDFVGSLAFLPENINYTFQNFEIY